MREQDAAFNRAQAGYDLFGEPLKPYSQSRKDAAELMGLQYPFLSDEDAERLRKTNRYPAMKRDVAIVLWLCGLPDAMDGESNSWTPEKAFCHATGATAHAMAWLNEQPWGQTKHPQFLMAAATALAIILDAELSDFIVKVDGGGKSEKKSKTTELTGGHKQPPESTV